VDSATPESDISFLAQKVNAGAHFIITQLFYDVEGFVNWVKRVRAAGESLRPLLSSKREAYELICRPNPQGVDVPIIPGIMPIQNYASFRRLTNLCKCPVPETVLNDLDAIKVSLCHKSQSFGGQAYSSRLRVCSSGG
jgi:methylenetetrahydrofolate reductase (NADPH)